MLCLMCLLAHRVEARNIVQELASPAWEIYPLADSRQEVFYQTLCHSSDLLYKQRFFGYAWALFQTGLCMFYSEVAMLCLLKAVQ